MSKEYGTYSLLIFKAAKLGAKKKTGGRLSTRLFSIRREKEKADYKPVLL